MKKSIQVQLSRLMLAIRGAVSMYELEGCEIARVLFRHDDFDLTLAFHEIGNALYLAQDTISDAIQALEKPEHLPQHSGQCPNSDIHPKIIRHRKDHRCTQDAMVVFFKWR